MRPHDLQTKLDAKPKVSAGRWPTPLDRLDRLGDALGVELWAKRDDLCGFALGGNKIRQLEHYVGEAKAAGADTLLITGAIQSNFVRSTSAFAAKFGFECHVQLEERVPDVSDHYRKSGNALLDRLFGAHVHHFPMGEDEAAADQSLERIACDLREKGRTPYVIHLSADRPPIGALGYIQAAIEIAEQMKQGPAFDAIYVASGSASTHCGLLFGLRAIGIPIPILGICVRRAAQIQRERVLKRCGDLAGMLDMDLPFDADDVITDDRSFGPGYGQLTDMVVDAVTMTAQTEAMLIDPVYTARVMAALMDREKGSKRRVLFWHTGGEPALFAYADKLS